MELINCNRLKVKIVELHTHVERQLTIGVWFMFALNHLNCEFVHLKRELIQK